LGPMTDCEHVRLELGGSWSPGPPTVMRKAVADHLSTCAACRTVASELGEVCKLVSSAPLEHEPPSGLEQRVFDLIELDPVIRLAERAPLELDAPPGLEMRVLSRVGLPFQTPGRPWSRIAAVLAPGLAAVAVLLALLGINWRSESVGLRSEIKEMEHQYGHPGDTIRTVSMTGPVTPESKARVALVSDRSSRYRLVLNASRLAPTPPGFHYELWLIGERGTVSSVAFRVSRPDNLVFNVPLGVDPSRYPKIELTLEPDDGGSNLSGPAVMTARLGGSEPVPASPMTAAP
jgi:hypothetical protein